MQNYRWFIGDIVTGRRLLDLPVMQGSTWRRSLNQADSIHAVVPVFDPDVITLQLYFTATPGKAFLGVAYGDYVIAAGPIWSIMYDKNARTATIDAEGLYSYFEHRVLLPTTAATSGAKGADSTWTNFSLGTIASKVVQQTTSWSGGGMPIIFPGDLADTGTTRTYLGSDVALVSERLMQLSEVINGPDIDFMPQWQVDILGVQWVMRVGTPTQPDLYSTAEFIFNASVSDSPVKDIQLVISGTQLSSQAWSTGGRATDDVLISRSYDSDMIDKGFPLLEVVDSNHTDLVDVNTLQGYSDSLLLNGQYPVRTLSFTARTDQTPELGTYNLGDYITLRIKDDEFLPDGDYRHRVVTMSSDSEGRWVSISCQPDRGQ